MTQKRSMEDHFERVAGVYSNVRITDREPIDYIGSSLTGISPLKMADIGCGSGRYSRMLYEVLDDLSLICIDSSRKMLDELEKALTREGISRFEIIHASVEVLELDPSSCDGICSFNAVHHFDLPSFLVKVARALKPNGHGFIYTRTPHQNAGNIWGQFFPQFLEKENRLYRLSDLVRHIENTPGLEMAAARCFRLPRQSSLERLLTQARSRHYSTFAFYTEEELESAITGFENHLREKYRDPHNIYWQDQNTMVHFQRVD